MNKYAAKLLKQETAGTTAVKKIEKNKSLRKVFLIIMLGILAVVLLGFSFATRITGKMITEQNIELATRELSKLQKEFDNYNRQANMLATQILLDDVCAEFLFSTAERKFTSIDIMRARRRLCNYRDTSSVVDSVYMYNRRIDRFLSSETSADYVGKEELEDQELVKFIENTSKENYRNLFRRTAMVKGSDEKKTIYSCMLKNTWKGEADNVIIVNLALDNYVFAESIGEENLQDNYILVTDDSAEHVLELGFGNDISFTQMEELLGTMKEQNVNHMKTRINGESYFAAWSHSEKTELDYIKISGWDKEFASVRRLQIYMLFICLLVILAGGIGAGICTAVIYYFYNQLPERNRIKISEKILLKEKFLDEFLFKSKLYGKQKLYEKFSELGMEITENQLFSVLILQLENYAEFVKKFGENGTYDIKYGFCNIFEEIFSEKFKITGLINKDSTLAFLLTSKDGGIIKQRDIEEGFRGFCESVKPFVDWKFSLIGSSESTTIEKVPEMVEKLYNIRKESFFYPSNSYFTYEQICEEHKESVDYQKLNIDKLIKSLKKGEEIRKIYGEFSAILGKSTSCDYMNAMLLLGVSVSRNLNDVYMRDADCEEMMTDFLDKLTKCEKKEKMDELFHSLFEKFLQMKEHVNQKKGAVGKVNEVEAYIQQHYTDPNMNLESLGEEFGVSASYLGRIFKKETGLSVADYINGERMKYSIKLLEETDQTIRDVAEECGFVNQNYFYTYFKKKTGTTPAAYRERFREQNRK